MPIRLFRLLALMLVIAWPRAVGAQSAPPDLRPLSLQELMAVPVATPSRIPESRLRSSASVFVLTYDDIRRSGAISIPEVLRLVPGLHVAQIDANKWAIGTRGFTDRLARAMLVLIDGRAVYSPLFAGTYWEVQDIPLNDIDRIEVVRGPGGSLWGANAVTGIINIIRKPAAMTPGASFSAGAGTSESRLAARYGGGNDAMQYRVSGKATRRTAQQFAGGDAYDDAHMLQAGARADWHFARSGLTLQGDIYRAEIGQRDSFTTLEPATTTFHVTDDPLTGANVLARWTAREDNPRALRVQASLDRTTRSELTFSETQIVADIDMQQGAARARHGLLWGASYRYIDGRTGTRSTLRFYPPNRVDHLFTAFLQDEIGLVGERLTLTLGTKVERNSYSGVAWQPGARLLWVVSENHAVSASFARAVRTPSRVEHDFESGSLLNPMGPTFVRLVRNQNFQPEELLAFDAGIISVPHPNLLLTATVFRNQHDRVMSLELGTPFVETGSTAPRVIVPVSFGNTLYGTSVGAEVTADVRPASWLRATMNYSALRMELSRRPGSADAGQEARGEGGSPRHQVQATMSLSPPGRISVDWSFRSVSSLPALRVPKYATSNVTMRAILTPRLTLVVTGRNLHHATHAEFTEGGNGFIGIRRSALVDLRWNR